MAQDTDIPALEQRLLAEIGAASDARALEGARIAALGRKGRLSELMGHLGALPPDQRKQFGQAVNALKQRVSEALEARKLELDRAALAARLASEPDQPEPGLWRELFARGDRVLEAEERLWSSLSA